MTRKSRLKGLKGMAAVLTVMVLLCLPMAGQALGAALEIDDQSGGLGSQVVFTVSVNSAPNKVDSLGADIGFDASVLEYVSGDFTGTLMADWTIKQISNPEVGVLRLGGLTMGTPIAAGSSGNLVKITFNVIGGWDCKLPLSALKDDITGWGTKGGQFTYIPSEDLIYVDCGGGNCGGKKPCHSKIQEAIDQASAGFTIKIAQGVCDEGAEGVCLNEAKALTLEGGWDPEFNTGQTGYTTMNKLTISNGEITASNLVMAP